VGFLGVIDDQREEAEVVVEGALVATTTRGQQERADGAPELPEKGGLEAPLPPEVIEQMAGRKVPVKTREPKPKRQGSTQEGRCSWTH
jgi:hypothetical protein